MSRLNLTHDQIRAKLYTISILTEEVRHKAADLIIHLSDADDWYPEALRRGLHTLESAGILSELDRHAIEKAFFS